MWCIDNKRIGERFLKRLLPTNIALLIYAMSPMQSHAQSAESHAISNLAFNSDFLHSSATSEPVDLTALLSSASAVPPGTYRVDIAVNGSLIGRRDVLFSAEPQDQAVRPCITVEMLDSFGVDMEKVESSGIVDRNDASRCYELESIFAQAKVEYDSSRLRLNIEIPQVFMSREMRGYVSPDLWDQGVLAGYVNYQVNTRQDSARGMSGNTTFVGLQTGANIGAWRLRSESSLSGSNRGEWAFRSNRNFAQRDITSLRSQLSIGDIYTDSSLFESSRLRGVKMESDDAMLADSERGYAPVVRGIAESSATVEVRQNGFLLYSATVPAGPFALTNIFPSGSNGDLEITVIEADGRRKITKQAFSSLPLMVRKGRAKYSVSAGRLVGNDAGSASVNLATANASYGLTDGLTGTAGAQVSDDFFALNMGMGTNTPIGAVSMDVTHSHSRTSRGVVEGQSLRMLYAKTFTSTRTNFTLAAYRYSTEGYRTLNNHVQDSSIESLESRSGRSRARLDLSINQQLGDANRRYGNAYLNLTDESYWDGRKRTQSVTAGYGNVWGRLNYDFNFTRSRNVSGGNSNLRIDDTQVMLSLSMPLGGRSRSPRSSLNITRDGEGRSSVQAGVNGSFSDRANGFYSATMGRSATGSTNGSVSAGATLPIARIDGGYSQGSGYRSLNVAAAGSIVAHAGGVNMGPSVGETFALVRVEGADRVGIASYAGSRTGSNGYAVVPYAQPYRVNQLAINTQSIGTDVEMAETVKQVVPRRGAIVVADFVAQSGRRVQMRFLREDGSQLPFGAGVFGEDGRQLTVTDPSGKALVLLNRDAGEMVLRWEGGTCKSHFSLGERNSKLNYEKIDLICR